MCYEFDKNNLKFCYPPNIEDPNTPLIPDMYPHYNLPAKIFRENIMGKAGDVSAVRGFMTNLMYYTKPNRLRKIDVMDFIYNEIWFGVMEKRVPAYGPYIQAFINRVHYLDVNVMNGLATVDPDLYAPTFIEGPQIPEFAKNKGPVVEMPSSSCRVPIKKKKKLSKWKRAVKGIFLMCKSSHIHSHEANERSKKLAREENARLRAAGQNVVDGSDLVASVLSEYENPYESGEGVNQPCAHGDEPSEDTEGVVSESFGYEDEDVDE